MGKNTMYEGQWGSEASEQIDAYYWLVRNGYPVAGILNTVAEREKRELEEGVLETVNESEDIDS